MESWKDGQTDGWTRMICGWTNEPKHTNTDGDYSTKLQTDILYNIIYIYIILYIYILSNSKLAHY